MFKKRSTWIIIALAVVVVISIAGISAKFAKARVGTQTTAQEKILITFYMENTPDSTIDAMNEGDPVRETVQNANFGKIVSIERGESIFWATDESGMFVSSPRKGYSSLKLTMETLGTISDSGVSIDKSVYYVGQTISLYAGKSYLKDGRIAKIEKAEK